MRRPDPLRGLNYKVADGVKQAVIMEEASKRYLMALAFTGLNSKKHKKLKLDAKHDWARNNTNSLSRTYKRLMEIAGGKQRNMQPAKAQPQEPRSGTHKH